jgi:hypothetical protein
VHYLSKYSQAVMRRKLDWLSPNCPLGPLPAFAEVESEDDAARASQPISSSAS